MLQELKREQRKSKSKVKSTNPSENKKARDEDENLHRTVIRITAVKHWFHLLREFFWKRPFRY